MQFSLNPWVQIQFVFNPLNAKPCHKTTFWKHHYFKRVNAIAQKKPHNTFSNDLQTTTGMDLEKACSFF
jgi:hypothetical protein